MKKFFLSALLLSILGGAVDAATFDLLSPASTTSTSGGLTITVNVAAATGKKVSIYSMIARSDLSTSVVQVQRADATGVTSNYTTKFRIGVGATTLSLLGSVAPIFVLEKGYAYRFLLDSTTANSLVVTYGYE